MKHIAFTAAIAAVLVVGLAPERAKACGLCGCSLAPPGDIEFSSIGWDLPEPGTLRLSLESRQSFHTTQPHPTVLESTFENRNSFFVAYTPHRYVTVQALVPVVYRSVEESDGATPARAFGVGDSDVSVRLRLFGSSSRSSQHAFYFSGGVKLPTAANHAGPDGAALGHAAQLGTGSWDPIASLSYVGAVDRVSMFAVESLRLTTTGRDGWRAGTSFVSTLAARYALSDSFALMLAADGIYSQRDTVNGAAVADTGGFLLYVTPSALMQIAPPALLRFAIQIPTIHANAGTQTESVALLVSLVFTHVPETAPTPVPPASPMI